MSNGISIKELAGGDIAVEMALGLLDNGDLNLEKAEIDANSDCYLDLAPALRWLSPLQFTSLEDKLFSVGLISKRRSLEKTNAIFSTLDKLTAKWNRRCANNSRIKPEDFGNFLDKVASQLGHPSGLSSVEFIFYSTGSGMPMMTEAFDKLQLDLWKMNDGDFAQEFADKINRYISQTPSPDPQFLKILAKVINKIHDYDLDQHHSDKIREEICENLSPQAAYLMISLAGSSLYPTSLMTMWRKQKVKNPREWIEKADSSAKYVQKLTLNLSSLNLTELMKNDRSYFLRVACDIIINGDNCVEDGAILVALFDSLLPDASDDERKDLATTLENARKNEQLDSKVRWTCAFLLKYYGERFDLGVATQDLPEIPVPAIPRDAWIKDGAITAELFLYNDPLWFDISVQYYRTKGWKVSVSDGGKKVTGIKNVKGIALKVILTLLKDNAPPGFGDPQTWDIRVHRGHGYTVELTIPRQPDQMLVGKAIFDGSCGSLSNVVNTNFRKAYEDNMVIADIDTGEGNVNCEFVAELMESVANGNTNWEKYDRFRKLGLRFPTDPALLLWNYVDKYD